MISTDLYANRDVHPSRAAFSLLGRLLFRASLMSSLLVLAANPLTVRAQQLEDPPVVGNLSGSRCYDSNLYRLPRAPSHFGINLPASYSLADQITDLGGGVDVHVYPAEQAILLRGSIEKFDYARNSYLNHLAKTGFLDWDWRSGRSFSGSLSATYNQRLAGFVNERDFVRDVLGQTLYAASVRYAIGSDTALRLRGDSGKVDHDAAIKQYQNNRNQSGTVGLEYFLSGTDLVSISYRQSHARFADASFGYTDKTARAALIYTLSGETRFEGDTGWHQRRYARATTANFQGIVGNASLVWPVTHITSITVSGWQKLDAYINNEADYYVSRGGSMAASWRPVHSLVLSVDVRWEQQDYKGYALGTLATVRNQNVSGQSISLQWTPRKWLEATIMGRFEHRISDDSSFTYHDHVFSAKVRAFIY